MVIAVRLMLPHYSPRLNKINKRLCKNKITLICAKFVTDLINTSKDVSCKTK